MDIYCAASDVKNSVGDKPSPQSAGLTSNALPEVQMSIKPTNSQTGVSTNNVLSRTSIEAKKLKTSPIGTLFAQHTVEKKKHTIT